MTLRRKKNLKIASALFAVLLILFIGITYSRYRDLRKALAGKLSDKATLLLGQDVSVGDLSFGPSAEISLHDIIVNNPRGFAQGRLLAIRRLSLSPDWRELLKGGIHLKNVEIRSPEITLVRGEKGITNVSEELKRFLSKKGTTQYQVDEVMIRSGTVSVNNELLTIVKDIDLSLKNISSREEAKTSVKGTLSYVGNAVRVDGQLFLNKPDRDFSISVSSGEFGLSAFTETLAKYGIDAKKAGASLSINAEGNMGKGCTLSSRIGLKGAKALSFYRGSGDVFLESHAFYDIREDSLAVNDLSLREGNVSLMHLKGSVAGIGKHPSYTAEVTIGKIDLSHFNVMKAMEIRGEVTSDGVRIKGDSDRMVSEVSGVIRVKGGAVRSAALHLEQADAGFTFSTAKEISLNAVLSARVLSLEGYRAEIPVDASLSFRALATPQGISTVSDIHLSSISTKTQDGTRLLLDSLDSSVDGIFTPGGSFAGRGIVRAKGLGIGVYRFPAFSGSLHADYRKDLIALREISLEAGGMKASASGTDLRRNGKRSFSVVEIRGMNADYDARDLKLRNADLTLQIYRDRGDVSGSAVVSGEVTFQGIPGKVTSGTIRFSKNEFSLSIPDAGVAGGRLQMNTKGKVSKEPFPLEAEIALENIDMGVLSRAPQFSKLAYGASGTLEHAGFKGVADSPESLQGKVLIGTKNLSLVRRDNNRTIVKGAGLDAEIICKGKDCEFRSEVTAGGLRVAVSGGIRKFAGKEREVTARALLPDTKLTDVRTSFWDIFPDGLLYAGLDGGLSADVALEYSGGGTKATGTLRLASILLQGENGEYSIGPVNGEVPFQYDTTGHGQDNTAMPSFEPSEFAGLSRYYAREFSESGYQRIALGSFRYGFRILDEMNVWVRQSGSGLNIGRFSATMFGGRLNGSAVIDLSEGLTYRAGILLEGLSLTKLCEEIEPIKGYLSGMVNGVATIKGSGAGLSRLIGKADFWAYSAGGEKTKISREFLQKVGGPSLKAYLGDRSFDKGVMSLYLQNGFAIFRELEISHRNLIGVTDLSVKVAPFNNRIEIGHLLWTMTEAAERAKDRQ